jgi:hypothetical protein
VYVYINRIDTPEVKKNDPPVATDDYVTTTEDNCVTINVKANDSDPNGDIITTCSSVVTNPKEGTASVNLQTEQLNIVQQQTSTVKIRLHIVSVMMVTLYCVIQRK